MKFALVWMHFEVKFHILKPFGFSKTRRRWNGDTCLGPWYLLLTLDRVWKGRTSWIFGPSCEKYTLASVITTNYSMLSDVNIKSRKTFQKSFICIGFFMQFGKNNNYLASNKLVITDIFPWTCFPGLWVYSNGKVKWEKSYLIS